MRNAIQRLNQDLAQKLDLCCHGLSSKSEGTQG